MAKLRIHKYLAQCGIASRRAAELLVADGLVCVNRRLANIGDSIDTETDEITIEGQLISQKATKTYIMLNKPRGYISSCSRSQGAAIPDLVKITERVYPVGRLDKESEGLVLLTDDGDLANKLTHPRYGCEKEYEVFLHDEVINADLDKLKDGIKLDDGMTKPCKIKRLGDRHVRIIISEGKNRQIRRMFQAVGKKVVRLRRVRIKGLLLGELKEGAWRPLTKNEVESLKDGK